MKREASLETLRALAAADDAWYGGTEGDPEPGWDPTSKAHFLALKAYRLEIGAQRRTKADVDADIVSRIRNWSDAGCGLMIGGDRLTQLRALCSEPYGPAGAAAKESREDIAAPGGATIPEDDPFVPPGTPRCPNCRHPFQFVLCGPSRQDDPPSNGTAPGGAEARRPSEPTPGPATALEESAPARGGSEPALPCPGCGRPMARVGGPGARRGWTCVNCNAAGDPVEDHPDERPCGCEDSDALRESVRGFERQLSLAHARNVILQNQLDRIRRLARSLEVRALFEEIDREP